MSDDHLVTCEGCTHSLLRTEAKCTEDGVYLCPICADCEDQPVDDDVLAKAKAHWDADRAKLKVEAPDWEMPAWSRTPAWRRWPYINAAKQGKHPDDGA